VIEGREPEAPSVTPDTGPVSRPGIHAPADGQTADLGAIRRSDALIDMLAGRRSPGRRALRDPAVALLSSLTADIDAAPCRATFRPVMGRTHRMGARHQGRMEARHQGNAAAAAAAAIATAAALAAAAGLILVAMLTRLTGARGCDRSGRRPAGPGRRY
jgi:hypothetical protein